MSFNIMEIMKIIIYNMLLVALLLSSCREKNVTQNTKLSLIPQVSSIQYENEQLDLNTLTTIKVPNEWSTIGKQLNSLHRLIGLNDLILVNEIKSKGIFFQREMTFKAEQYALRITEDGIYIKSATYGGAVNAIQTYKQIVNQSINREVSCLQIQDQPRFEYRGLMLDCSRHFWTIDEIKQTIDQMSLFKLNKLHLHLTDNQAWRVEIKAYPKLITEGTQYEGYPELSGKYYTQEDLKAVVKYATERNIEVIPEIDLPGHAIALLAAYPELSCFGGTFEPYPEEMPPSVRHNNTANMICVGNKFVYEFVNTVVEEMSTIFTSNKIHLGGDEVPVNVWQRCEKCQNLYKKLKNTGWHEQQDYFTKKMSAIAKANGRKMIGWDEINDNHTATSDDIVMVWRDYGFERATEALKRDVPVIMTPQHGCYFDWGYAGNSTRKVYEWEPISEEMAAQKKNHLILGGQACLWTERVATQERVEEMLYPRLIALAEVLWSNEEQRNWGSFLNRLENSYGLLNNAGINYYVDDAINEKEFVPEKEKPALVRHAMLSSSIPNHGHYHLEYIFDGRSNTFYWGGRSMRKGDWYEIELGEPVKVNQVKVLTGDSKDYINHGDLLISFDGKNFNYYDSFDESGVAEAILDGKTIKKIRIQITKDVGSWPVIREVKIE